ncbi:hypothetical protein [Sporosarcina psychrophila]|uniref:Amino acid transporter n=1 Tax=Sporosarcina psychrophila TaxID=1476 RepID=A0ABV2KDP5_SPOPS
MNKNKKSSEITLTEEDLDRRIKETNRNLYIASFSLIIAAVTLVIVLVKIVYQ